MSKNIQVIDGAANCTFTIFSCSEEDFNLIFPNPNQDLQFNSELDETKKVFDALNRLWTNPVIKTEVKGIHGTLFYNKDSIKEYFPKSRVYRDINRQYINEFERQLLDNESVLSEEN